MSLSIFFEKHGKKLLALMVIILLVIAAAWLVVLRPDPLTVKQAQKATDEAVRSAETTVASADKVITKAYQDARKKVTADNAEIKKHVENLDGDAVASELTALLDEYRRERDGGD